MKNFINAFALFLTIKCGAQMPLPCYDIDNEVMEDLMWNDYIEGTCIHINTTEEPLNLTDANIRIISASKEIRIDKGTNIQSGNGGIFMAAIGGETLEAAWFEPTDSYVVPQYEKVEWGIKLPDEVESAIDNWIQNQATGSNLQPSINPFDPEQIDVQADITYVNSDGNWTTTPQPVFGFYFRDFDRITKLEDPTLTDPDQWYYQENATEYRFRIRWAPTKVTNHKVKLKITTAAFGDYESTPFYFESSPNSGSKSFVKVSPNGHYLMTYHNNIFFPIGQNLPEPICDNEGSIDIPGIGDPCTDYSGPKNAW